MHTSPQEPLAAPFFFPKFREICQKLIVPVSRAEPRHPSTDPPHVVRAPRTDCARPNRSRQKHHVVLEHVAEQLGPVYRFFYNKWYFDELYERVFIRPSLWLGRQFWKLGDVGTIDRFGPNGAAWVVERGSMLAKRVQSGYVYSYALVMLLGLVAAVTYVLV